MGLAVGTDPCPAIGAQADLAEAADQAAHPDGAIGRECQGFYIAETEAIRLGVDALHDVAAGKRVGNHPAESLPCTGPDAPFAILDERFHECSRQAVADGIRLHPSIGITAIESVRAGDPQRTL